MSSTGIRVTLVLSLLVGSDADMCGKGKGATFCAYGCCPEGSVTKCCNNNGMEPLIKKIIISVVVCIFVIVGTVFACLWLNCCEQPNCCTCCRRRQYYNAGPKRHTDDHITFTSRDQSNRATTNDPEPTSPLNSEPTSPLNSEPTSPLNLEATSPFNSEPSAPLFLEPTSPLNSEPTSPLNPEPTAPLLTEPTAPPLSESATSQEQNSRRTAHLDTPGPQRIYLAEPEQMDPTESPPPYHTVHMVPTEQPPPYVPEPPPPYTAIPPPCYPGTTDDH